MFFQSTKMPHGFHYVARFLLIPALLSITTLSARAGGFLSLTENGNANAVIVLPAEPHEHEASAADELRDHIARISGAELTVSEVGNDLPADVLAIRLGGAADAALESAIREQGDSYSSFALFVDETGVNIRFGEENTVSVKVTNDRLAELGTGGIVAPVMFWSPHDPDWQP